MTKQTAVFLVPVLAAVIAVGVPATRHEIRAQTRAIMAELDWLTHPDGYRWARELSQAVRIYKDGTWLVIVSGCAGLGLCYFFMDALAVTFGTHPSLSMVGLMTAVGLMLWIYVVPPWLRSAQELAYAAAPVSGRAWLGRLASGGPLMCGSLMLVLIPALSHLHV